jgi:branched-chain amino acid transport system substrate-binding protein
MTARHSRRQILAGGAAVAASGLLLNRRASSQAGPIRLGMLQSISGPLSSLGNSHVIGARIAVKMINDAGGVDGRPIELVIRDTRSNAGEMVAGLRELAGSGINLFIGEAVSGMNIAAQPVAPSLDIVYVLPTSIAMELTHELGNRNCFRANQNAFMQFGGEAKLVAERYPDLKRWGCFAADAAGLRGWSSCVAGISVLQPEEILRSQGKANRIAGAGAGQTGGRRLPQPDHQAGGSES